MCVGVPGEIAELPDEQGGMAVIDVQGTLRRVSLALIPETPLQKGDWVDVYMGMALEKLTAEEAADALAFMEDLRPAGIAATAFDSLEPPRGWQ